MYIFISHSSKQGDMAEKLCKAIEDRGDSCFLAPRDIRLGHEYAEELIDAIERSDALLLLLSKDSNTSPHVLREIERAVTKSIPILVYKVEEVELTKSMEYFIMTHQWMDVERNSLEDVVDGIQSLKKVQHETVKMQSDGETNPSLKPLKESTVKKDGQTKKRKKLGFAVTGLLLLAVVLAASIFLPQFLGQTKEVQGEVTAPYSADLELGDTFSMGTYNGEEINWRVLKISEDGSEAVVVARDVLTVKAFDAAESGRYNHDGTTNYYFEDGQLETDFELQAYVKGNSSWANSNIRTWLNSTSENVKYEGQAPISAAMADGVNGYNSEKGFLCSFTEEELSLIKTTKVKTKGNILSDTEMVETEDKIFLLSLEELEWFEEANVSMLAVPTQGAIAQNQSSWYDTYCVGFGVESIMWWLRDPVEGSSTKCYLIGNGYRKDNLYTWEVGVESFGIRPAMTIDLSVFK